MVVAGPTGSGKSELALRLAEEFQGEVVNCDSLQLYRHLDIGTAKLPAAERRGIPHHLLDLLNPDEVFTAGEYARRAREILAQITSRGKLPLVVGGTGFYIRALLDGLVPGPTRDDALRARLARHEQRRPGGLHRLLERFDPPSARRIQAADAQKLIRALEIILLTRRPLSALHTQDRDALQGYRALKLALNPPRPELFKKLDLRCARMFETGLLDEVRQVLALGFVPASKALEAHGYRQALQVIEGGMTLAEAVCLAQRNTRRYAKRQWTWFRREPGVVWLDGFGASPEIQAAALARAAEFLRGADDSGAELAAQDRLLD